MTFVLVIAFGSACISFGHARTTAREGVSIALVFVTLMLLALHEGWSL